MWHTLRLQHESQRGLLLDLPRELWQIAQAYDLAQGEISQRERVEREESELYERLMGTTKRR